MSSVTGRDLIATIFDSVADELISLFADNFVASWMTGWVAPFKPSVIPTPPGRAREKPAAIKPARERSEFEVNLSADFFNGILDGVGKYLRSLTMLSTNQIDFMRAAGANIGRKVVQDSITKLFASLARFTADSIAEGRSTDDFRKKASELASIEGHKAETLYRTFSRRAYNTGLRDVLDSPAGDPFVYRQYLATMDNRVRDTHADMNDRVYHRDSRTAQIARELLDEWNCRCTEVPITKDQAESLGIDDDSPLAERTRRRIVSV